MHSVVWDPSLALDLQLERWIASAATPGVLHVVFSATGSGTPVVWRRAERWTRSRAVTLAEIAAPLTGPVLGIALCADVVALRHGVELRVDGDSITAPLVWALGRAGRAALARGLLDPRAIAADEAVRLGLVHHVIDDVNGQFSDDGRSLTALTIARDLSRSSVDARSAIELASFRLLFASGDPYEGARAFLEKRPTRFGRCED